MSQQFTGTAPNTGKMADGTALQDEEHAYPVKFWTGIFKLIIGFLSNAFQIFSSTLGWALIASGGTLTLSTIHPSPLMWACLALALIVQGFLHKFALSSASTWNRLRAVRIHGIKGLTDKDMYQEAFSIVASMNTVYLLITMLCDIASDATFGRSLSSVPAFVIAIAILPTGGSTLLLYSGGTIVYGAIQDAKDHVSYALKHGKQQ